MRKKGYGFIDTVNEQSKILCENMLDIGGIDWMVTSSYADRAKNHCAAVAIGNIYLYGTRYEKEGALDQDSLFDLVHKQVGNGPILRINSHIKYLYQDMGKEISIGKIKDLAGLKQAIDSGNILSLLLKADLFNWHWVLVVGYRSYKRKTYLLVVDGWNKRPRYLQVKGNRNWVLAYEYRQ